MPKQKKRNPRKISFFSPRRLAFFFITIGIILLLIPSIFYLNQYIQLAYFSPEVIPVTKNSLPKPAQISIPKVKMNLSVGETTISGNVWGVYNDGASYLTISARPGENGPIIFYAHNTNDKFGTIRWLNKNDEIFIKTVDGKNHVYKITETLEVAPDKMDVFDQTTETLILYTCTGFGDLKRFVVIAKPI